MTTAVLTPGRSADHYRLGDVVRSEWTKFTSLRSNRWILAGFAVTGVALGVLISALTGHAWPHLSAQSRAHWDPTNNTLAGLIPGYLLIPMLGVLMMSSEYSSDAIRSTLAAVPKRQLVLVAKVLVFAAVAFVVDEVVTFAAFLAGQQVMGTAPHATLGQPGVLRALVLSGAFLALMGLLGLGIGTIIRRSAWAIAAYAGIVLVLPMILVALPGHAWRFGPLLILGNSEAAVKILPGVLSPWAGFAVMTFYAAGALVAGTMLLVRRDA
jgi:ABC-type transport system involved in multi-copper enzyme maturation permease subunit